MDIQHWYTGLVYGGESDMCIWLTLPSRKSLTSSEYNLPFYIEVIYKVPCSHDRLYTTKYQIQQLYLSLGLATNADRKFTK